jgi:hypothetical protein
MDRSSVGANKENDVTKVRHCHDEVQRLTNRLSVDIFQRLFLVVRIGEFIIWLVKPRPFLLPYSILAVWFAGAGVGCTDVTVCVINVLTVTMPGFWRFIIKSFIVRLRTRVVSWRKTCCINRYLSWIVLQIKQWIINQSINYGLQIIYTKTKIANCHRLILRWENLGIFSQSQLRTYIVKSDKNTFRGVNWKMLRLSKVLLHFTCR